MSNKVENTNLTTEEKAELKAENKAEFREWLAFQKKEFVKNVNIVKQLVLRSIKVQYRNSVIGVFWTILNPLLNMLVMYLVFSSMFQRSGGATPTDGETYALYLLCGNIVFGMMRTATFQSLPSIVQNRGLLTKNKMSYNVFPLSYTLSAVVNFGFSFIALLGVMLFVRFFSGQAVFSFNIFLVLVALPALFLFSYGLSLVLSAMYTFFRDIKHFYNVFLTLWMYLTPIFYNINMFDNAGFSASFMKTVIKLNPMYYFVEYFRDVVYRCSAHEGAISGLKAEVANAIATGSNSLAELQVDLAATIEAAQLPGVGAVFTLYAIGGITTLIGAIVFMATKRKFIYNI
ncbi:MAG: ABC transporter permease [Clostridia bacterium]|nr:ABC transporter permease [Clostridia bacterium]